MYQRWDRLTFLHWPYEPPVIASLLPPGLHLDTFAGTAWIGLTPFVVKGLRLPGLPPAPWLSNFPEINVRTYVRGPNGYPGIWFFSLEADRLPAVLGARLSYGLPYRWAKMRVRDHGHELEYVSRRHQTPHGASIRVQPNERLSPNDLEIFLTARFRLYTIIAGELAYAQVDHRPWPLHAATAMRVQQNVIEGSGVPAPEGAPLVHFSPGVDTKIGWPTIVSRSKS